MTNAIDHPWRYRSRAWKWFACHCERCGELVDIREHSCPQPEVDHASESEVPESDLLGADDMKSGCTGGTRDVDSSPPMQSYFGDVPYGRFAMLHESTPGLWAKPAMRNVDRRDLLRRGWLTEAAATGKTRATYPRRPRRREAAT